jgi:hypothetical protein
MTGADGSAAFAVFVATATDGACGDAGIDPVNAGTLTGPLPAVTSAESCASMSSGPEFVSHSVLVWTWP